MKKNNKEKSLLPINLLRDLNLDDDDSLSQSSEEEDNQDTNEPVFNFDSNNQNKINFEQPKKEKKQNQRSSALPVDIEKINVQKIINPIPKYVSKRTSAPTLPNEELENLYKEIYQRKIYKNSATNVINENNKNNQFKIFLLNNKNSILPLINSYSGSHFLQKMIDFITLEDIDILLDIINNNLPEIMCNSYGNYFFQKIIIKANVKQRIQILSLTRNYLYDICKDNVGNHCIQTIVESLNSEEEEKIFEFAIRDHLLELSFDLNSTHIIQKLIINVEEKKRFYLIKFIINNFYNLTINLNGATIAKKFINEIKDYHTIFCLLNQIELNYFKICKDQYANYVIQHTIEVFGYFYCRNIINLILNQILILSIDKYSSNVIDKVMIVVRNNNINDYIKIIYFIFFNTNNLELLNDNKFGHYVIFNIIKGSPPQIKILIKNAILNNKQLNISKYSKILNYLNKVNGFNY